MTGRQHGLGVFINSNDEEKYGKWIKGTLYNWLPKKEFQEIINGRII